MTYTIEEYHRAVYRNAFLPFLVRSFAVLHEAETTPFIPNWHTEAMANVIEQIVLGGRTRQIMEVPPRHLKSICTSVAGTAWMLGRNPSMKILVASYGADLAGKHARDTNRLMTSAFYRDIFPNVKITLNRTLEIETSQGGVRKATSVSGPATGFGADVIIGDDIQKAGESASELETQRVHEFYSDTLLSRLNNQKTGKILIVQQRLAENDLPGYLREKGNFHILSLPVIAPADEKISLGRGRFHLRKADSMLFPQRDSREVIDRLRKEMGESAFSAQYLQNPSPPGGNRIRMSWFGTYELKHDRNWYQKIVQSWDTAMSAEPTSDYSVCMTWGYREMKWYLLDVHREKHDFPDLVKRANALDRQWTPDMIVIEDGATGKPLFQELQRCNLLYKLCLMHPTASKNIRLEAQTIKLQNETFILPKEAPWLQALKHELQSYPNGRYDDQVDSLTQFLASLDRRRSYQLLKLGRRDGFSVPLPKRRRLRPKAA